MSAPRLDINLDKITHNARMLAEDLGDRGIAVTGITKAALGSLDIAKAMLRAGMSGLGDSRIENIEAMRQQRISAPIMLIRSPMLSQVNRVVRNADISFNTELSVVRRLSAAAEEAERSHGIVLMVELGDLREGILPEDLVSTAREVMRLPNLELTGIGTNLACHSGMTPDADNMGALSALADRVEAELDVKLVLISGGNSANLDWALSKSATGRINHLRLGEAILLGCEPLHREPVDGLHTDAITLVAEVIESKTKPSLPWGTLAETAFGGDVISIDSGAMARAILAVGEQDLDPDGLLPPEGLTILGASGDHLLLDCGKQRLRVGDEVRFGVNYSALVRAMTSPFVEKKMIRAIKHTRSAG
ncbi:alanine/ornithine racemase family PLP-dependent enzyme [uncultured Alcanivorax sp.]|jgi:predicted amino acid racemase|uniref:alanine/ornithine racemase family PLP-dependent enzyme n=1 Tax=uncultured Alcanivorax sp. TaxID=191215 RepID=UPI0030D7F0BA